jgi:DNA-directed RNA polymerase subunit K/omega
MKYVPIEQIWERFPNKYDSIIAAAVEARRVIEAIRDGKIEVTEDPYLYALKRAVAAEPAEKKASKKKTDDAAS